ncbi:MAG: GWxTD domain-containing protein [Candidatus Krumholzibacteriia bacterium]
MHSSPRVRRSRRSSAGLVALLLVLAVAAPAGAALLRPLEGSGNFLSTVDVLDRPEADGSTSLILLISVANRDLTFRSVDGRFEGTLGVAAELAGYDGEGASLETTVALRCDDEEMARSATTYQILPLVLRGVRAGSGRLSVTLTDQERERPGLISRVKRNRWARSEVVGDWVAPETPRDPDGLTLGDPVFLARAPIAFWRDQGVAAVAAEHSVLTDYLHPNRRYGLEQKNLQLYFEVEAPARNGAASARDGVYVQVLAKDLAFALHDTISFDAAQIERLSQGGTTGVFYDLNLKDLPPGAYQLSCAPGNGWGRAWVAEFDVIWSAHSLNRFGDELEGEGRTVLFGDEFERFELAGQAEKESILERFWQAHDPDPSTPINEGYLEFRRRVSYVREYLGGFNRSGPVDPRGTIYVLLGAPDEISREVLPLNDSEQKEALARVFDQYVPQREGTQIKGTAGSSLQALLNHQSRREILARQQGLKLERSFELWSYDHAGWQIFPNRYSGQNLGLRFLFVDRNGTGAWSLDTTNAVNLGG